MPPDFIIGTRPGGVKATPPQGAPKSLPGRHLVCYDAIMRTPRFLPAAVLAVLLAALAGGFFGSSALARQDEVSQQYRVFNAALDAVSREYVDDLPSDRLVYGAIDGMLHTLDPHSSFFDPKAYAQMRERQEGHYYGLGITIQVIDGDITVQSIFEGSPAYKAGLRRVDVIARIGGQDAKGWTSDQAVKKLKGPKGTTVNISIKRAGYDGLLDMDVQRDEVNITTVRASFMIDKETGYIKLDQFTETSDREMGDALQRLSASGMKRLVFDLRENPGGALDQAIRISNRFLPRGDDDRLHARPRPERQPGIPRHRGQPVHAPADGHARHPRQRQRLGDRQRCAPGSRSVARRRRDGPSARPWCSRSIRSAKAPASR